MKAVVLPAQWRQAPTAVLLYLVGIFLLGFTIDGGIYAVLQNLYLLRLGYGPEFVGIFNSSGLFIFALLSLPIGTIRRWSNRRLLLIGVLLTLIGMVGIPLAQWSPALWQPTLLLSGRILSYIGLSFFFVHGAPYLMTVTTGDWQNRALAWQSATLAVAGFVGGLLGGYLPGWIASWLALSQSDPTPYQYPLFLGAGVFGLAFFAFWRTPEPILAESLALARGETAVPSHPLSTPKWTGSIPLFVVMLLLVRALQVAAPGAILTFANVFFDDGLHIATDKIGIVTAIGKLLSIPVALATPWVMARWGGFRVVIIISLISVIGALPMALSENWILAGLGYVLAAGAGPLRYLAFLVFTLSLVHSDYRATITGAGEMAIGFGFALMAFVGGYLIANYGYGLFFGVSLGLTLVGTGLYWLIFRGHR